MEPVKLSDLILSAVAALQIHGDLPVWVELDILGYDDTDRYTGPMVFEPNVDLSKPSGWSKELDGNGVFVISGQG